MIKVETLTFEYEHCGDCPHPDQNSKWKCSLRKRIIPVLWGEIPEWCPLETKREEK